MTNETDQPTTQATDGIEETTEQPKAVLAQVALMPDGQLSLQLAEAVTDKILFCMETSRLFIGLALKLHHTKKQIVIPPPGMKIPRVK